MTKNEKGNVINKLKTIPNKTFVEVCDYLGLTEEDTTILKLRFRTGTKYTREYVAEEVGISPSTLDRRINFILYRITSYCSAFLG